MTGCTVTQAVECKALPVACDVSSQRAGEAQKSVLQLRSGSEDSQQHGYTETSSGHSDFGQFIATTSGGFGLEVHEHETNPMVEKSEIEYLASSVCQCVMLSSAAVKTNCRTEIPTIIARKT